MPPKGRKPARKAAPEAKIGRPTRCTPTTTARICRFIEKDAVSLRAACELSGVPYSTAKEWRARGLETDKKRPPEPEFAAFAAHVARAERRSELSLVGVIRQAAHGRTLQTVERIEEPGGAGPLSQPRLVSIKTKRERRVDWKAAAYLLERRFPAEYTPNQKVEHSGDVTVKRIVGVGDLVADLLAAKDTVLDQQKDDRDDDAEAS